MSDAGTNPTAEFDREMAGVAESRPPISASKIAAVTKAAFKCARHYKAVVHSIERFVVKGSPDQKLPGLYLIDSICRGAGKALPDHEAQAMISRFEEKLESMFPHMLSANAKDKERMKRLIQLWKRSALFNTEMLDAVETAYFPDTTVEAMASPFDPSVSTKAVSSRSDPRLNLGLGTADIPPPPPPPNPTAETLAQPALDPLSVNLLNTIASFTTSGAGTNLAGILPLLGSVPGLSSLLGTSLLPTGGSTDGTISAGLAAGGNGLTANSLANPLAALVGLSAITNVPVAAADPSASTAPTGPSASPPKIDKPAPPKRTSDFDYDDDDDFLFKPPKTESSVNLGNV
ncbi:hypothetical protein DFJ73DRAFT_240491 [Zopfochytrium polystomum]|nr:hypothetical protein DFJ73DRAFT_240491 [Zopfochytrium polystomum]